MTWIVGHRGAAGIVDENTLLSVSRAYEMGVDAVEVDLRQTADHRFVLLHDATVDRTTNGRGRLADMTLDDLRQLKTRPMHQRIPTLDELLATFRHTDIHFLLELKEENTAYPICRILRDAVRRRWYHWDQFRVISFQPEEALDMSRCFRAIPVGISLKDAANVYSRDMRRNSKHAWIVNHRTLYPDIVSNVQRRGQTVFAYTVNERARGAQLARMGVDGIITDRPDLFLVGPAAIR